MTLDDLKEFITNHTIIVPKGIISNTINLYNRDNIMILDYDYFDHKELDFFIDQMYEVGLPFGVMFSRTSVYYIADKNITCKTFPTPIQAYNFLTFILHNQNEKVKLFNVMQLT